MPWTLDRDQTALILIDVQERINGAMSSNAHQSRIRVLLEAARILDVPVVATEQYPKGLGPTVAELGELLDNPPLEKSSFSCWRDEGFRAALEDRGSPRQLVLTGIEAHVCVMQTALDLAREDHQVFVAHDAVNSRRERDRDWGLERMQQAGVAITSTESVLFELLNECSNPDFRAVSKLVKTIPL